MADYWGSASFVEPNLQTVQESPEPSIKGKPTSGGSHPGGLQQLPTVTLDTYTSPRDATTSGGSHPGGLQQLPTVTLDTYTSPRDATTSGGSHPGGLQQLPTVTLDTYTSPRDATASGGSHPGGLQQLSTDDPHFSSPQSCNRPANLFSNISPRRYLSADQVMAKYARYKNRRDVGRLAIALAKHTYFGTAIMASSTITGRGDTTALDPNKLEQLKANIRSIFPTMSDAEFEAIWGMCVNSVASACKNMRRQKLAGTL